MSNSTPNIEKKTSIIQHLEEILSDLQKSQNPNFAQVICKIKKTINDKHQEVNVLLKKCEEIITEIEPLVSGIPTDLDKPAIDTLIKQLGKIIRDK